LSVFVDIGGIVDRQFKCGTIRRIYFKFC